jgi:hypothetical protein
MRGADGAYLNFYFIYGNEIGVFSLDRKTVKGNLKLS